MDKFEKLIKKTVDSYEAPYSEAAWAAMSDKLGPEKGGFAGWIAGAVITAAAVIFGVWYLVPGETNENMLIVEERAAVVNEVMPTTELNDKKIATIDELDSKVETVNIETDSKIEPSKTKTDDSEAVINVIPSTDDNLNFPDISSFPNIDNDNVLEEIIPVAEKQIDNIVIAEKEADFSKFNLQAVADKVNVCVGEEVNLSPSIPKLKASYQWIVDGNNIAAGPYAVQAFDTPGNHTVSINLISRKTGKVVNESESVSINVAALPQNEIAYEFDNSLTPRVNFSQKNMFHKAISWDLKGLYQSNEKSFSYDFKNKGNYVVSCSITGENGCKSESSTIVNIKNSYNLLAPSAFTPNGDNLNETFIPKALLITTSPFIMTIYDKSGKLVFETNDASRPWDGLYTRDLSPAPGGSYVWIVQLTTEQNKVETYQGQVTITR